ncbi:hypothetical protein [Amycolatopsis sp. NPDC052450]
MERSPRADPGTRRIMWMVLVIPLLLMSFALLMERAEANMP